MLFNKWANYFLGHSKVDLFIDTPRKVSAFHGENKQFVDVHASDAATVVASTQVFVFFRMHILYLLINIGHHKLTLELMRIISVFVECSCNKLLVAKDGAAAHIQSSKFSTILCGMLII